jgi:hypothetical protein
MSDDKPDNDEPPLHTVFAAGGTVRGEGVIIRKGTGERIPFKLTSDPLTEEQAAALNGE